MLDQEDRPVCRVRVDVGLEPDAVRVSSNRQRSPHLGVLVHSAACEGDGKKEEGRAKSDREPRPSCPVVLLVSPPQGLHYLRWLAGAGFTLVTTTSPRSAAPTEVGAKHLPEELPW